MITNVRAALTTGLLACLLATSTAGAAGQVHSGFSYRGQLMDNGAPADGRYDIEFALHAEASGGLPIDVIRSDAIELHDGMVDAPLDFIGVAADRNKQWVEVRMRETGSSFR